MLGLLGGAAASTLARCTPTTEDGADPGGRLVILISVDSLRASRIGAYGYDRPTTPALDRFARQSFRFSRAWSECSWTKPSMASLFLSRPVHEHLVIFSFNRTVLDGNFVGWLPDVAGSAEQKLQAVARGLSVPEALEPFHGRLEGFKRAAFVNNPHLFEEFGFNRSWNVFRPFPTKVAALQRGGARLGEAEEGMAPRIHARALRFIDHNVGRDTYVWIHHNDVHYPYGPVAGHASAFGADHTEEEFRFCTRQEHQALERRAEGDEAARRLLSDLYDAGLRTFDDALEGFFADLRSRGLYDRATIVVTSDHGEEFWEHGVFGHGNNVFGQTTALPLFVKLPDQVEGRVVDSSASLADVGPTILESLGFPPDGLGGRSLLPALGGGATIQRPILSELVENGYELGLVQGRHRLRARYSQETLFQDLARGGAGTIEPSVRELYDLEADPDETTPLALEANGELLERLQGRLVETLGGRMNYVRRLQAEVESGRAAGATIPLNPERPVDKDVIDQLEALGYL